MTTEELDITAIRDRADSATLGPWEHVGNGDVMGPEPDTSGRVTTDWARSLGPRRAHIIEDLGGQEGGGYALAESDAEFIAAARQDVPALCDEVDRLRAAIREASAIENEPDLAFYVIVGRMRAVLDRAVKGMP
jgi:hypothetical protein